MTIAEFLTNFGEVANAPGGVARLRELIYNLAVTGALSAQMGGDGDGQSLLAKITAKRLALSEAGVFKRSPKLENLRNTFSEHLPKIPTTWAWSRLVEVGEISPKNEAEDANIASFAPMSAISEMHSSSVASEDRPWGNIKRGYTHFANGDVVLAKITPCFENGKAAVMANLTNGIGAGTTELHVVRPITGVIEPAYIYVFLRSPYFKIVGEGHMTGTAGQKRLPTEYFATRPLPLPPLAEQERIVAKVDELMALCDQLEAQQRERQRRFPVLSRTCHARFAEAPTPENLNRIFDETGAVSPDDLRKTILSLALRGSLVPQSSNDEPVSELMARTVVAKREFSSHRRAHAFRSGALAESGPFVIPESWTWADLGSLGHTETGKTPSSSKPELFVGDIPFIGPGQIRPNGEIIQADKFVSEVGLESSTEAKPNDILMVCIGGSIGKAAIVRQRLAFNQQLNLVRPIEIEADYLFSALNSEYFYEMVISSASGSATPIINRSKWDAIPIPVPPLAEQRRIVAKVDELMALVDQLEEQQQERDKLAEAFAKACVASFTGTTQLERPEKMKAPNFSSNTRTRCPPEPSGSNRV